MRPDEFEARMRRLEYFHALRVVDGAWPILRIDGRSFTRLTETGWEKPFDRRFHEYMIKTTEALMRELHGVYGYTESDEISILLPLSSDLFSREVEKLVSVSAGIASAEFTHHLGKPAHFDARVCLAIGSSQVVDYFRWRQSDAGRCCLNGWCYWTLRGEGLDAAQTTRSLEGRSQAEKHDLLFTRGINFNELPNWQKRGTGIYWSEIAKPGFNPLSGEAVFARRRRLKMDEALPLGDAYEAFLLERIRAADADPETV